MSPIPPSIEEIKQAQDIAHKIVRRTPLVPLHGRDDEIWLKLETLQPVHSFKLRGVFHAVSQMSDSERERGISTVSAGNTAQALAWCGRHFGVAARSVMPDSAPAAKIAAVRDLGGEPILTPMSQVFEYMQQHLWEQEPYSFVHPWTNRHVMIGHGTMGLEIAEDLDRIDSVFVPVGGGGLLAGVGWALKQLRPEIRIWAVEPEQCAAFAASLEAGQAVAAPCDTLCDGVAVPYMTEEMFPLLRDVADQIAVVPEEEVKSMVRQLAVQDKLVVEPSGALAAAAALRTPADQRGRSVCIVTGGSIDAAKLAGILQDGVG